MRLHHHIRRNQMARQRESTVLSMKLYVQCYVKPTCLNRFGLKQWRPQLMLEIVYQAMWSMTISRSSYGMKSLSVPKNSKYSSHLAVLFGLTFLRNGENGAANSMTEQLEVVSLVTIHLRPTNIGISTGTVLRYL